MNKDLSINERVKELLAPQIRDNIMQYEDRVVRYNLVSALLEKPHEDVEEIFSYYGDASYEKTVHEDNVYLILLANVILTAYDLKKELLDIECLIKEFKN